MGGPLGRIAKSLTRWARIVSDGGADGARYPVQRVEYMGKAGDAVVWFPYGFHANVPADELALLLSLQGNPEARVGLPGSPTRRPAVAAGEVVIYHPPSGSRIHFQQDGSIAVTSTADLVANVSGNAEIAAGGDVDVVAGGQAIVDGTSVELGGIGGPAVARVGDTVSGGVIQTGSAKVNAT